MDTDSNVYMIVCLTKGITPKICGLCVCVLINERSFEPFICLDLVLFFIFYLFLTIHFCWCNLLIYVVSMIIVRSV